MQDEHVAIILYICMIQALSYSLIFYRNLENRNPQFTDTACIVECFCIILFTSLDFPIKCFHKRLQGSAFIWSYLILICMEIFCSLFVPLTHLTTQSLRPCQKTVHLKTEILSKKKINHHVDGRCHCAVSVYKLHFLLFFSFFPFSQFEDCSLCLWCLGVCRQ